MCLCRFVPQFLSISTFLLTFCSQVVSPLSFFLLFRFFKKVSCIYRIYFFLLSSHYYLFTRCPIEGSGNVLKVQQLLHICSEHFDSKDKEEDKDKKEKKDKDKKEAPADMGAHQVWDQEAPREKISVDRRGGPELSLFWPLLPPLGTAT